MSRNARAAGACLLGYLVLAMAYTWPLADQAERRSARSRRSAADHVAHVVVRNAGRRAADRALVERPDLFPGAGIFGFSEHLLGLVPIAAPLTALTHQPLIGHNVAFIPTFVLSALGAHFLAYTITKRHDAVGGRRRGVRVRAIPAGAGASHPGPRVVLDAGLPRGAAPLRPAPRARDGPLIAVAAWVMQALSCGYYLFFLGLLIALWFLWFAAGRWPVRRLAVAIAAFAAGALLLAPLLPRLPGHPPGTYGFKRSIGEIRAFSADVAGLLYASDELLVWGWVQRLPAAGVEPLSGPHDRGPGDVRDLSRSSVPHRHRRAATDARPAASFTGLLVLLLIATRYPARLRRLAADYRRGPAGVDRARRQAADAGARAALAWMASPAADAGRIPSPLGAGFLSLWPPSRCGCSRWAPIRPFMDQRALYQAPYRWLMRLPGFDGLRVPARFWMMALVCLSVVAALTVDRLPGRARRSRRRAGRRRPADRRLAARVPGVSRAELRPSPPGVAARLDLPINDDTDAQALYQQMFDPVPLYNGFSGYVAPHYHAMRSCWKTRPEDPSGPRRARTDWRRRRSRRRSGWRDAQVRPVDPGATVERMERDWSSYRVPRSRPAGSSGPARHADPHQVAQHGPQLRRRRGGRWTAT